MSNDINDKNYPFSGSATDLSSIDEKPLGAGRPDDKNTKSLQELISSNEGRDIFTSDILLPGMFCEVSLYIVATP